ncbi:MAG: hypothetical protein NZM02_02755, partial [Patescibacteria group bacterium]|nr:hypothetical protein [Patescibacteria group bacterium]
NEKEQKIDFNNQILITPTNIIKKFYVSPTLNFKNNQINLSMTPTLTIVPTTNNNYPGGFIKEKENIILTKKNNYFDNSTVTPTKITKLPVSGITNNSFFIFGSGFLLIILSLFF